MNSAAGSTGVAAASASHVRSLRHEGEPLAATVAGADLDAAVPTCPQWVLRDLVRHVGMVHRWATVDVTQGRDTPLSGQEEREQLKRG